MTLSLQCPLPVYVSDLYLLPSLLNVAKSTYSTNVETKIPFVMELHEIMIMCLYHRCSLLTLTYFLCMANHIAGFKSTNYILVPSSIRHKRVSISFFHDVVSVTPV